MNIWSKYFFFVLVFINSLSAQSTIAPALGEWVTRVLPDAQTEQSASSINVEISNDAELLVSSIFRNQSCFLTENHTYFGFYGQWGTIQEDISQLGTFTNGADATGIDQGIIMSTGRVTRAEGPNTFTGTTQVYATTSSDPDLAQLAGTNQLFDVSIVEFDFTPTTDVINFDYVFASEEYCEAVNNTNVDVFGFFISGPGINGPFSNNAENIAVLPDGSPVNVNNINHLAGNNPQLYRSNVPSAFGEACQTTPPVAPNDIEYDGMTTILTASSPVIPCETYHLKLIIADVGDTFYDSAVLLEAGSFAAGLVNVSEPGATAQDAGAANAPIEGCSDGYIIFSRLDSSTIGQDLTVYFNISPTGTATFGVDYTMPTDSFTIDAGLFSDTLFIDIFSDNLLEGTENIIIRLEGTCNCAANTTEFFIVDPPAIDMSVAELDTMCSGSVGSLVPIVNGGFGSYQFDWSTGSMDSILNTVYTPGDSLYVLTVTDECGQFLVDSITLTAPDISANLNGNYIYCEGGSVDVPVVVSGADNYTITVLENGTMVSYTGGPDTIFLNYSSPTSLELISVTAEGCTLPINGATAQINVVAFGLSATVDSVSCFGTATGSISLNLNGANSDYSYQWGQTGLSGHQLSNLAANVYDLTITDNNGCSLDTMIEVGEPLMPLVLDSLSSSAQNCAATASAALSANGGTPSYTFDWGDGGADESIRNDLNGGQTYIVTLTDSRSCATTLSITPQDIRQNVDASIGSNSTQITCETTSIRLGAAINATAVNYLWRNAAGISIGNSDSVTVNQAGDYQLIVSDPISGCADTSSISITQSNELLVFDLGGPYSLNCNTTAVDLVAIPTNHGGSINYRWTGPDNTPLGNSNTLTNITTAGTYTLVATRLDNNCTSTQTISVTEDTQTPSTSLVYNDINCNESIATLLAQNNNTNYQYTWSTLDGQITSGANQANITANTRGRYSLQILDMSNGCTLDTFVDISADFSLLTPSAGPDQELDCSGAGSTIIGNVTPNIAGTTYRWIDETGNILSNNTNFLPPNTGTFLFEVTHPESGCVSSDEVVITRDGLGELQLRLTQPPCEDIGGIVDIRGITNGTPPYSYSIDGAPFQPLLNDQINGFTEGIFLLEVSDSRGCIGQESIQFFSPAQFTGYTEPLTIRLGEDASLSFSSDRDDRIMDIRWEAPVDLNCTNCFSPLVELPLNSFTALVSLTDSAGCTLQLNQQIFVDRGDLVYAPTGFSPGRLDGINDHFTLYGDPRFVTNIDYLRVFNRWGDLVWENQNLSLGDERQGWDGTHRQKLLGGDTFVFVAQVTYFDGVKEIIKGEINIVR